jgi:hypothetical protein
MKSILLSIPLAVVALSNFEHFEEVDQVNSAEEKLDPLTRP